MSTASLSLSFRAAAGGDLPELVTLYNESFSKFVDTQGTPLVFASLLHHGATANPSTREPCFECFSSAPGFAPLPREIHGPPVTEPAASSFAQITGIPDHLPAPSNNGLLRKGSSSIHERPASYWWCSPAPRKPAIAGCRWLFSFCIHQ